MSMKGNLSTLKTFHRLSKTFRPFRVLASRSVFGIYPTKATITDRYVLSAPRGLTEFAYVVHQAGRKPRNCAVVCIIVELYPTPWAANVEQQKQETEDIAWGLHTYRIDLLTGQLFCYHMFPALDENVLEGCQYRPTPRVSSSSSS